MKLPNQTNPVERKKYKSQKVTTNENKSGFLEILKKAALSTLKGILS